MIQLQNITLDLGTNLIFDNINVLMQDTDHIGLIGRNGAGKSTLLKLIAGHIQPTAGQLSIAKNMRIAYLPQEAVLTSILSVFDEAFSTFSTMFQAEKRIQELEHIITTGSFNDKILEEYTALQQKAQKFAKHEAIKNIHEVLQGLRFTPTMIQQHVNQLSTGWKMRLALAKLLLTDADTLLFDEPTNHLDIVTQHWLLQRLQTMQQGFILVSHDRAYLEQACTSILEIERGKASYFIGNLASYLQKKEEQLAIALATRERQERQIAQKQAIVDRFRAGTRAQQAKNIARQIERIELVDIEPPLPMVKFNFPTPLQPGITVLTCTNLAYKFNEQYIFGNATIEIKRNERVALVAANGVGKTTLLNCIIGNYQPTQGRVQFGHNVNVAYFQQDQAQALAPEKTVFQEIYDSCATANAVQIRSMLGSFLFSGDTIEKKIKVLSGGEKNRVAMVKVLLQKANFLILDEPTNHLDLYTKDVLRQALASYQGTILFVSHDLDFINKLATRIIELTPTGTYSYPGTYEEFCAWKASQQATTTISAKKSTPLPKDTQSLHNIEKQELTLRRFIERLEHDKEKAFAMLANYAYGSPEYAKKAEHINEIQKKITQAEADWEKLLEKV